MLERAIRDVKNPEAFVILQAVAGAGGRSALRRIRELAGRHHHHHLASAHVREALEIRTGSATKRASISEGFADVSGSEVVVMVSSCQFEGEPKR